MLQWVMMFVLPVGIRSPLRISAMISNLLRFPSKAFLVTSMLYYLLGKSRPFPKQAEMQKLVGAPSPQYVSSTSLINVKARASCSGGLGACVHEGLLDKALIRNVFYVLFEVGGGCRFCLLTRGVMERLRCGGFLKRKPAFRKCWTWKRLWRGRTPK